MTRTQVSPERTSRSSSRRGREEQTTTHMAEPPPPSPGGDDDGSKDAAIAKMAGFVVFSGIAVNIFRAFSPKPLEPQAPSPPPPSPTPSTFQEISSKVKPLVTFSPNQAGNLETPFLLVNSGSQETTGDERLGSKPSSGREIEIVRGDTLWGLSRKYGVILITLPSLFLEESRRFCRIRS